MVTQRMNTRAQSRGGTASRLGITMIEHLVVIAIIGIMASMLLPALGSAKERGKMAKCLNNIRQLGFGCVLYADDYTKFPLHELAASTPYASTPAANQSRYAAVYYTTKWLDFIDPYLGSNATVALCASDLGKLPTDATTFKTTGPPITYGMNVYSFSIGTLPNPPRPEDILSPAAKIFLGDTKGDVGLCHIGLWAFAASGLDRHGGNVGANYAFFDGHAEYIKKKAAWDPAAGNWQNAAFVAANAPEWAPWIR